MSSGTLRRRSRAGRRSGTRCGRRPWPRRRWTSSWRRRYWTELVFPYPMATSQSAMMNGGLDIRYCPFLNKLCILHKIVTFFVKLFYISCYICIYTIILYKTNILKAISYNIMMYFIIKVLLAVWTSFIPVYLCFYMLVCCVPP